MPSSVADIPQVWSHPIPAELRPPASLLTPSAPARTGLDLFATAPDEAELGWEVSTSEDLAAMAASLPFEPAMVVLSWMEAAYTLVRSDRDGQLRLARELFGTGSSLTDALEKFVKQDESHFAFDERQFATLRALLVREAADVKIGDGEPDAQVLVRALYGTSALFEAASGAPESPTRDFRDWVAFLVRGGAYYASRRPLHTIALAYALWVDLASRQDMTSQTDYCDIDVWLTEAHTFSASELLAIGFGIVAGTHILNEEQALTERAVLPSNFVEDTALAERVSDLLDVISADREWYAERVGAGTSLVWERTPFEQRPLLRLSDGKLLLTSPQAIWGWMGDGLYFRLHDIARDRGELERFSRFYGDLMEHYILELVASAHGGSHLPGSGRVFGEEVSGTKQKPVKTPDVAVDLGEDVVLMEVVSGRLTYATRVAGDEEALQRDLIKLLDKKLAQLSERIQNSLAGDIAIADLRPEDVRRVWPVLIISEGLLVAEPLWQHIAETHPDAFTDARIKPLTIADTHELELLMALVEDGHSFAKLLERKTSGGWWVLPVVRWVHDAFPEGDQPRRPNLVDRNWNAAWNLVLDIMFPHRQRD